MSEIEIALAQAYLAASGQDAVTALIRSVKDLARTRNLVSPGVVRGRLPGPSLAPTLDAIASGRTGRAGRSAD